MSFSNVLKLAAMAAVACASTPAYAVQAQEEVCTTEPSPGPDGGTVTKCETVGTPVPEGTQVLDRVVISYFKWSVDSWYFFNRPLRDVFFGKQTGPASPGSRESPTGDSSPAGCKAGNPIVYSTGNKIEPELDFTTHGEVPLYLKRTYNHYWNREGLFGKYWVSNFDLSVQKSADGQKITAWRNDGSRVDYVYKASPAPGWYEDRLQPVARIISSGSGYIHYAADNTVETYNAQGQVTSQKNSRGIGLTFNYSSGRLVSVVHTSGRQVAFTWTGDQLTTVTDPAGKTYAYTYNTSVFGAGLHRLASTVLPGTPATTITYHYPASGDISQLLGKSFNGERYSTFGYDSRSRATSSEHAGGVEKYTFAYTSGSDGLLTVLSTNPLGKQTTSIFRNGKLQTEDGHVSANCPASERLIEYDSNGFVDRVTDANSNLTDYDYNLKGQVLRKLEAVGTPATT